MNYPFSLEKNTQSIEKQIQEEMEKQIYNTFGISSNLLNADIESSTYTSAKLQFAIHKTMFPGIQIFENKYLIDKKQIRRHKKKRINKKWNKRYGYKYIDVPKKEVFQFENKIVGHPDTMKKIVN